MKPCDVASRMRAEARQAAFAFGAGQRGRILAALTQAGDAGLTADELEADLSMSGNSVRPRLMELRESGEVVQGTDTRRTRSGRLAVVYRRALSPEAL